MDRRISEGYAEEMKKDEPLTPITDLIDYQNRMIEHYKKNVDIQAIRANLKLTVQERVDKFIAMMKAQEESDQGVEGVIGDQGATSGNRTNKKDHGH